MGLYGRGAAHLRGQERVQRDAARHLGLVVRGGWHFGEARAQPAGRGSAAATWDATHNHFLVGPGLGLNGNADDTWAYEPAATTWTQQNVANPTAVPLRQMTGMGWDDATGRGLLFGGRVAGVGTSNDLWAIVPTTPTGTPTPSPTPASVQKALDVGSVVDNNGNSLVTDQVVSQAVAAGATYVRVDFHLAGPGVTSWTPTLLSTYDGIVAMFRHAGLKIIGLVSAGATNDVSQPDWTANNAENTGGNGENAFISGAYVPALRLLVGHFRDSVSTWELWNEPNDATRGCSGSICSGGTYIYPSNFAALLADSYLAIKETDAITGVTLLSGGLFGHSNYGVYSAANSGATYLTATYHMGVDVTGQWKTVKAQTTNLVPGGTYPLDAVGQHLYLDISAYSSPANIQAYLDWVRQAYRAYEGAATPKTTIVTEAGWPTAGQSSCSPDQQADNVDALYWGAKAVPYTPIVTWFQLQDKPSVGLYYGLYDASWTPKLAVAHYQAQ